MKKITLLFSMLFVLGLTSQLKAQDFQSAIGGRIWYPAAVSYKFFISEPAAIELYAGFRGYSGYGGFTVGGQYEHHMDISDIEGFQWYFGGGASASFYNYDYDDVSNVGIGINGVIGLQYTLANAPWSFTVDWMPTILISDYNEGFGGAGGAGARYILK